MKTKKTMTLKANKLAGNANDTKTVPVQIARDPENSKGLRGLRGMVFGVMGLAWKAKKDLPTMDVLTKLVSEKYPQSRWIARPKIHYSYYKSKFLQSVRA